MAKIIYESFGPNYQVPGLPYEESYTAVHPVIMDSIPSPDEIREILMRSDPKILTNPWSVDVLKGFRDYVPTTFRRVTHNMPLERIVQCFGDGKDSLPEADRVLLQLQTEIEAKAATIDAAIVHGRRELGTVVNKAHVLNRLYMIGRLYGHVNEREYPFLFGDLTREDRWDSALSEMKQQFIEYILELPVGERVYKTRKRKAQVSSAEIKERFPYVEWLKEQLGDDLIGILLYGSASRTKDPSQYSDFDNWVRVRDVKKAQEKLKGTKPSVVGGKLVLGHSAHEANSKHVGIHFFPESEEYLRRHIRFLHDSREFMDHTLVLHGEFNFPKISMDEVVERGVSHAYVKLKTVAGSLNWAFSSPEKLLGKPSLFEFIVKNIRFFYQHSLNAMVEPAFRDKTVLNKLLKEKGIVIPEYKPDVKHIQDSLLYSMTKVMELQKELIDSGRKPHLEFLKGKDVKQDLENWDFLDE